MPLTLVHPVAVLPLARGRLSLLPLVCGALAADLPYFLRASPLTVTAESWYEPYTNATSSHSLGQLITVGLPLAVVVYLCGRFLLPPLRWTVGLEPLREPASNFLGALVRGAWTVVSLLIGFLTHLAWDALTESGASGSRLFQHASTALGLLILVVFAWRRRTIIRWNDATVRRRLMLTLVPCALVALAGAVFAGWSRLDPAPESGTGEVVEVALTDAVKGAGAALIVTAVALGFAWWTGRFAGSVGRHRVDLGD